MKNGNDPYERIKAELDRLENFRLVNPASEAKLCQTEQAIRQMKHLERRVRQILAGRPKR